MKVYFASDHAGFELKKMLIEHVKVMQYEVEDCGAYELDPDDDYPAFIAKAAEAIATDPDSRAILIGGSGEGEAIVANRFKNVRAVVFYGGGREQMDASGKSLDIIASSRMHNNANALSLGSRFLGQEEAIAAVERWLTLPFPGEERHVRRIAKFDHVTD